NWPAVAVWAAGRQLTSAPTRTMRSPWHVDPGRATSGPSRVASPHVTGDTGGDHAQWVIHGERVIDENPHIRVSLADVELPDGTTFTQYVFRMRRCVIVLVLDERGSHLLLVWRHRFVVGKWVWELPGGYVDDGEDGAAAAVREAEEESGWRPRNVSFVL